MLSALVGTACVPLLYVVTREGWGRLAGFVAAWLMAVSHLHIHYSRLGFIFIESVAAMLLHHNQNGFQSSGISRAGDSHPNSRAARRSILR